MKTINQIISELEQWTTYKVVEKDNGFFQLAFFLVNRNDNFLNPFSFGLPEDLLQWWARVESAELYKDVQYGQWGLELLSEKEASKLTKECFMERPEQFRERDVVMGHFFGDSDLLISLCEEDRFGSVMVALPIDERKDWYTVSSSFTEFLEKYIQNDGNKFWE